MVAVYFMHIPLLSVCTFSSVFVSLCTVGSDVWSCMDIVMYALAFQTTIRTFCMATAVKGPLLDVFGSLNSCQYITLQGTEDISPKQTVR